MLARAYVETGLSNATATLSETVKEIRKGLGGQELITILASIWRHLDYINSEFVESVKTIKERNQGGDPDFTSAMDTILSKLTLDGAFGEVGDIRLMNFDIVTVANAVCAKKVLDYTIKYFCLRWTDG